MLCCSRANCRCLLQLFLQCCGCAGCSPSVPHIPVSRGGLLCAHRQGLAFPVRARSGNERRPGWPPHALVPAAQLPTHSTGPAALPPEK